MTLAAATANIRRWREHPASMVRELWGVEPDPWQVEALELFPHHQRIAMKASKGVGKTCLLAWLIFNFLLTRPHPKITAVSVSAEALAATLWTELSMWMERSPLLRETFRFTKTRIFAKDHPETWWISARSYSKTANKQEQSNTLAGLHADYIMFVLDESGSMPEAIMASAEAALSSCKEGHIVQAGNPTHLEGPLYAACTSERRLWHVVDINGDPDNPNRAPRISIEWAREQIEKYGRDNPFVTVNVFGQFPPNSLNVLIGPDEIMDASRRSYHPTDIEASPRILGVDVALYGDDASVIFPRQGLVAFNPMRYRSIDGIVGAGIVARKKQDWNADAVFLDNTGGFGTSWADQLRLLGHAPIPVNFSQEPNDRRYFNKRAEMYFLCCEWIKGGAQLPPEHTAGFPELLAALTRTSYTIKGDRLLLEPKDLVKKNLGYSPDDADALVLTFAHPVAARTASARRRPVMLAEYDPFAEFAHNPHRTRATRTLADYDPYGGR